MAGNTPRGIRKRLNATGGEPRYQVRYLIRDPRRPHLAGSKRQPPFPPCAKQGVQVRT